MVRRILLVRPLPQPACRAHVRQWTDARITPYGPRLCHFWTAQTAISRAGARPHVLPSSGYPTRATSFRRVEKPRWTPVANKERQIPPMFTISVNPGCLLRKGMVNGATSPVCGAENWSGSLGMSASCSQCVADAARSPSRVPRSSPSQVSVSPWRGDTGPRRLSTGTTMPEETIDPGLLEQTKNQIRKLVAEIADLAESDIQPAEFYVEFLNRAVAAVAATRRRVLDDGRPGRPEAAISGRVRRDRADGRPGQDRAARRPPGLHAPGVAGPDHPARAR